MTSSITAVQDIPTLTDLHRTKELPEPSQPTQYKPDAQLNDRVSIWRGNIVKLECDMIVNAANKSLLGGGGVDGAIHRAAGRELYNECKTLGGADTGETKVTKGYELPAKWVAHTVGPVYAVSKKEEKAEKLKSCYRSSLELCQKHGGGSIGFSSISTGVYGYPIVDATRVALETTRQFLEKDRSVTRVIYVVFSEKDEKVYRSLASEYFPAAAAGTEDDKPPKKDTSADESTEDEDRPLETSSQATVVGEAEADDKAEPASETAEPKRRSMRSSQAVVDDERRGASRD